jgi:class 3 adenylate cyclase
VPGRDELDHLLDEILRRPERRDHFEARIEEGFVAERAVLVLDMSGFSRTTQAYGIVEFLLMIRRLRRTADPIVARHRGDVLKAEADNLFCLFPSVVDAVAAAREIVDALENDLYVSIGIGFGRMLLIGDDDVLGGEVNLASKLGEDVAGRGEILLTEGAHAQVADRRGFQERAVAVSGLELRHFAVDT